MAKRVCFLLILLAIVIPNLAAHHEESPRFDYIGFEDGLSSSSISSIIQDDFGFMWLGTQNGLNQFDGYNFTVYQNEPFNKNSLPHNLIQTMYKDTNNILWIGTYGGLAKFDIEKAEFTRYSYDPEKPDSLSNNVVVSIVRDAAGILWVGTLEGLNALDEETGTFTIYRNDPENPETLNNNVIRSLYSDDDGRLWVGSYGGLALYQPESDSFINYTHDPENEETISSDLVMDIQKGADGTLWLGLWGGGVTRFDPETERSENHLLSENRMYKLLVDGSVIWAASYGGGLIKLDYSSGAYAIFTSDSKTADALTNDTIYSFCKDSSGIIWIGTNGGGLNRIIPGANRFTLMRHNNDDPGSLENGKINALYTDSEDTLWVSIYNKGVDRYDSETDTFIHYALDPEDDSSISNNLVNFIYEDVEKKLWFGTNGGLNLYNREEDNFTRIYTTIDEVNGPGDTIITAMAEDQNNNLWIGTYNNGVTLYKRNSDVKIEFSYDPDKPGGISDNLIRNILCDSNGVVWIGTNKGLNRYNPDTGTFKSFYHDTDDRGSISSDNIYDLFEDSMGVLWIGTTGGGLNRYHPDTETFTHYSRGDGLSDNNILSILEDKEKNLWISTRFGLTIFSLDSETFRSITHANGFPSLEMSLGKTINSEGKILFGTSEGIVMIDPKLSIPDQTRANLILTEFRVLGEDYLGDKSPFNLEEVVLKYTDTFFDFEFAELQYITPYSSTFAYMLEGFDQDWIISDNRSYGSYTNIRNGKYTLKIKAMRIDGLWNDNEITVKITILPPFWKHPIAFVVYGILVSAGILFLILRIREKRIKHLLVLMKKEEENIRLEKIVESRTAEIAMEKERLVVTLRSIGDGVIAAGVDGTIQIMNKVAETYTGWNLEDAVGRPIMDVFVLMDNAAKNPRINPLMKILAGVEENNFSNYLLLISRNDTKRIVSVHGARIMDAEGNILGIVLVFRDMTEEQKMQLRLQRSDKLESLGVLAGGLAHDFNNLLGGLFGYIEMAKEISTQDEVASYLDHALTSFNRAKDLTHQLLTFSKGGTPIRKALHLEEVVRKSVSFALSGSNVSSEIAAAEDLWLCDADENQIGQVVDNLVINAQQAMPGGGVLTITLKNEQVAVKNLDSGADVTGGHSGLINGEYVAIIIKDTGSGIPPELMSKIFDPFFTTKGSGNGLGLATCYSIIEKHQGIIEVDSEPGEWSCFTVFLPKSKIENVSESQVRETEHCGSGTFLVMDDESPILHIAEKMLNLMGYQVVTASNGEEAIALCRNARENSEPLIGAILDLTIPGGDGGLKAVSRLREIEPDLMIFASSGYSNDPIMADPEKYGFTDSIRKPYRMKEFADFLNRHLG